MAIQETTGRSAAVLAVILADVDVAEFACKCGRAFAFRTFQAADNAGAFILARSITITLAKLAERSVKSGSA
jgi:hypothetical protein